MADSNERMVEIRLFEKNGETFIGKFLTPSTTSESLAGIVNQHTDATKYYNENISKYSGVTLANGNEQTLWIVANPAKVQWTLTNVGTGKSSIVWKIVPLFYKALTTNAGSRYFYYNMDDITMSSIDATNMDETLLAAYKDICGE